MAKPQYTSRRKKRKSPKSTRTIILGLCFVAAMFVAARYVDACDAAHSDSAAATGDITAEELRQVVIPDDVPDIFVNYTGFELSFNPTQHVPNYVAWELTGSEAGGEMPRESNFQQDRDILGCASLDDYRRSGFDRGHMAPAADMKWSRKAMADCHYLTNMCPQSHELNAGPWQTLENNCRRWAQRDSALIIVCGPVLTDPITRRIGHQQVAVPERFFKVVLAPWANPPRGIGFIMNNIDGNPGGVQPTAVSIDEVERITGFDFFSALPDEIETAVESQCNYPQWQRNRP